MRVIKVEAEGLVTSFRYPHFMWQKHPTFEMPPPATIYGHICSAVGEWINPAGLQFAYRFTFESKFEDLEHIHAGSLTMPFRRELLYRPRLILYVNRLSLLEAFRSPRYTVVLGRSQDLFTYTQVEEVELIKAERAYYGNTLLPLDMMPRLGRGIAVTMPRFLDYHRRRAPTSGQYVVLHERVPYPPTEYEPKGSLVFNTDPPTRWVDPTGPEYKGLKPAVVFHSFVD